MRYGINIRRKLVSMCNSMVFVPMGSTKDTKNLFRTVIGSGKIFPNSVPFVDTNHITCLLYTSFIGVSSTYHHLMSSVTFSRNSTNSKDITSLGRGRGFFITVFIDVGLFVNTIIFCPR